MLNLELLNIPGRATFLIASSEQFTGFLLLITELVLHPVVVEVETVVLDHGDPATARHRAGGERDLGPGVDGARGAAGAISSTLATFIKPRSCSQLQITTYFLQFIFLVTALISLLPLPLPTPVQLYYYQYYYNMSLYSCLLPICCSCSTPPLPQYQIYNSHYSTIELY